MRITRSEAISGSIFVIAADAEDAWRRALDYLRDEAEDYMVFDDKGAAESRYYDRCLLVDRDRNSIYSFTFNVSIEK